MKEEILIWDAGERRRERAQNKTKKETLEFG